MTQRALNLERGSQLLPAWHRGMENRGHDIDSHAPAQSGSVFLRSNLKIVVCPLFSSEPDYGAGGNWGGVAIGGGW